MLMLVDALTSACTWWSSGRTLTWCVGRCVANSRLGYTKYLNMTLSCLVLNIKRLHLGNTVGLPLVNYKMRPSWMP